MAKGNFFGGYADGLAARISFFCIPLPRRYVREGATNDAVNSYVPLFTDPDDYLAQAGSFAVVAMSARR
jgi:hypothetical protein